MVRAPFVDKNGMKKGAWSEEEDNKLRSYVQTYGHWNWRQLPKFAGLNRCGKSCRLRWMNYLKPGVRRGKYTPQEEQLILQLHKEHGNKWSVIASKLPGRTDNDIKNHWHTHLGKKSIVLMSSSPVDHYQTYQTSQNLDHEDDEESSSVSTLTLESQMMQINNYGSFNNNNIAASVDHSYSEVSSSSSYQDLLTQFDWTAEDSLISSSSVESFIQHFDENSFWEDDQPFSMDSFYNNNHVFDDHHDDKSQQQLAGATLEEEIMRPFGTPSLDEINIDYWLHELME